MCTVGGAIALAMLTTHPDSLAAALALLSLANVLIYAALPIFWSFPTAFLPREARAGGIALISSIGITSGIAGPWVVGQIKTATGSMDNALYILSALLLVCACVLLAALRKQSQKRAP